ncbi:MAG TPA: polysaccharide biosynthesis/export family protein [Steroidobacteraceae bacterium]|nr:polysaccharide biosynthesis/export family protein [Steroidobacteraceae bacterium]
MKSLAELMLVFALFGAHALAAGSTPEGYRLQPGDLLQVLVWKETDLQSEVLIRPDGGISFALAGDMQAAGLTTDQLREELETRVRKLVPGAVVTVSVKAPNGNRIFVIGKVARPGDFPLLRPVDVMQAISMAGGVTPFASSNNIRVLHRDGMHQNSVRFRYNDVSKGRHLEQNILLQSGDTVIVP